MVVPPPAQPELRPADEYGFVVSVQWPAVLQAAAYVVELREAGSLAFERFVRSAPEAKLGTLVELRVGGLRPGPPPGRVYVAQVRTIASDGSESAPSPPGVSPMLPAATGATATGAPGPTDVRATGSVLSADAAPWQPSGYEMPDAFGAAMGMPSMGVPGMGPLPMAVGSWAPPAWLGQPQEGGVALGSLMAMNTEISSGFSYAPDDAPPGALPPPPYEASIRPPPPSGPPEGRPGDMLLGVPPPGEAPLEVADDCLILD